MTAYHFNVHDLTAAAGWFATGAVIGTSYFLTLRWNVRLLATGRSLLPVIAFQFGRFAANGVALAAIAGYFGAPPLLAATAGILAARMVITRYRA